MFLCLFARPFFRHQIVIVSSELMSLHLFIIYVRLFHTRTYISVYCRPDLPVLFAYIDNIHLNICMHLGSVGTFSTRGQILYYLSFLLPTYRHTSYNSGNLFVKQNLVDDIQLKMQIQSKLHAFTCTNVRVNV